MSQLAIQVENLSKRYQLGTIGYGSLQHDLRAWWAKARGKEDPNARIGEKSRLDHHGEFWALQNVGFTVEQGDRVGIVGRNGAGKSTLLKLLSRVTSPTEGAIKVRGRIASLLEVGTGFHPELTGRENVFLNGAILGMKRREIQAKFDEIVGFAGVEQFIDTPVKRYSSGMYVRLAFSVAAHLDSEILILDEVLAVGDAEFQRKCVAKMESVSRLEGKTILFVSHNIATIRSLCNVGVFLEKGRLKAHGDIQEILVGYTAAKKSTLELEARKDRVGSGLARFVDFRIEQGAGTAIREILCGDPVTFVATVESQLTENPLIFYSLTVLDELGNELTMLVSDEMNNDFRLTPGMNSLVIHIPRFRQRPGQYQFKLFLAANGIGPEHFLDVILPVGELSVLPNHLFEGFRQIREGSTWVPEANLEIVRE